jgi:hypothetical protein
LDDASSDACENDDDVDDDGCMMALVVLLLLALAFSSFIDVGSGFNGGEYLMMPCTEL